MPDYEILLREPELEAAPTEAAKAWIRARQAGEDRARKQVAVAVMLAAAMTAVAIYALAAG